MASLHDISTAVQSGKTVQTVALVEEALKENIPPGRILREALIESIMKTEKRFQKNEILETELLVAERAMKAGLEVLMPLLNAAQEQPIGTVVAGTMEGDIRDIEKDIIVSLMRSLGLRVIDLGTSVSNIRFIECAMEEKANIIACTTSLTSFLPQMKFLVQAAEQAKIRGKTKILLSGGPVTEWFCKSIEADMYAPDLVQAAEMTAAYCKKLRGNGT